MPQAHQPTKEEALKYIDSKLSEIALKKANDPEYSSVHDAVEHLVSYHQLLIRAGNLLDYPDNSVDSSLIENFRQKVESHYELKNRWAETIIPQLIDKVISTTQDIKEFDENHPSQIEFINKGGKRCDMEPIRGDYAQKLLWATDLILGVENRVSMMDFYLEELEAINKSGTLIKILPDSPEHRQKLYRFEYANKYIQQVQSDINYGFGDKKHFDRLHDAVKNYTHLLVKTLRELDHDETDPIQAIKNANWRYLGGETDLDLVQEIKNSDLKHIGIDIDAVIRMSQQKEYTSQVLYSQENIERDSFLTPDLNSPDPSVRLAAVEQMSVTERDLHNFNMHQQIEFLVVAIYEKREKLTEDNFYLIRNCIHDLDHEIEQMVQRGEKRGNWVSDHEELKEVFNNLVDEKINELEHSKEAPYLLESLKAYCEIDPPILDQEQKNALSQITGALSEHEDAKLGYFDELIEHHDVNLRDLLEIAKESFESVETQVKEPMAYLQKLHDKGELSTELSTNFDDAKNKYSREKEFLSEPLKQMLTDMENITFPINAQIHEETRKCLFFLKNAQNDNNLDSEKIERFSNAKLQYTQILTDTLNELKAKEDYSELNSDEEWFLNELYAELEPNEMYSDDDMDPVSYLAYLDIDVPAFLEKQKISLEAPIKSLDGYRKNREIPIEEVENNNDHSDYEP